MRFKMDERYKKIGVHTIIFGFIILLGFFALSNFNYLTNFVKGKISLVFRVLNPVFIGLLVALVLDPLVTKIHKKVGRGKSSRGLATALSFLIVLVVLALLVTVISWSLSGSFESPNITKVVDGVKQFNRQLNTMVRNVEDHIPESMLPKDTSVQQLVDGMFEKLGIFFQNIGNSIVRTVGQLGSYVVNIVTAIVIAIYFLIDKKLFNNTFDRFLKVLLTEERYASFKKHGKEALQIVVGYVRGVVLDAIILGVIVGVVLTVIDVNYSMIIGVLAAFANLIPIVGSVAAAILGTLAALSSGSLKKAFITLILMIIVQQIDGNVLGPKILGKSLQLHPILILLSIYIFGSLYGLKGMIVAVPLTALVKHFVMLKLEKEEKEKDE